MFNQEIWPQNYSIERIDTPSGRLYNINNGEYEFPSITTVLSAMDDGWLKEWIEKVGEEFAKARTKKAATIGTGMHDLCEDYLQNKPTKMKLMKSLPEIRARFNNYKTFLDTIETVHLLERPVYSTPLGIAGTVDCVATINGKIHVIDHKTSFKLKDKEQINGYFLQASFYAFSVAELYQLDYVPDICISIAVDGIKEPQVFFEKPRNYINKLLEVKKKYLETTI